MQYGVAGRVGARRADRAAQPTADLHAALRNHGGPDVMTLVSDLRYGARGLLRMPASAALSVLILALGVGFSTVAFSMAWGVLGRGLAIPDGERVHLLANSNPERDLIRISVAPHDLAEWRDRASSFEEIGSYAVSTINMTVAEEANRFRGARISGNLLHLVGVPAARGRLISEDDDRVGAAPTVVLSDRVWRGRFGGDPAVLGTVVRINGEETTVIGIMPPGFHFPLLEDLWIPQRHDLANLERGDGLRALGVGRLRQDVTLEAASAELAQIADQQAVAHPETNRDLTARVETFVASYTGPELKLGLTVTLAAALMVLLVACANVANLLVARAAFRAREAAIRTALGGSRVRVVLPFVSEALLLAVAGALVGVPLAYYCLDVLEVAVASSNKPYWMAFRLDPVVLAFVGGLVGLISVVAGAAPALQAMRGDATGVLRDESRGSSSLRMGRFGKWMVTVEVAASCVLLVGAGLVARSMSQFSDYDFGLEGERVLTARIALPDADYSDREARAEFWSSLLEGARDIPGVEAAALSRTLPGWGEARQVVRIAGVEYASDRDHPYTHTGYVSSGFFETLGVSVDGRGILEMDGPDGERVAVVNRSFVVRHMDEVDPIGRVLRLGIDEDAPPIRIVGIVPDVGLDALGDPKDTPDGLYLPVRQFDAVSMSVLLRSEAPTPEALAPAIRRLASSLDPNLPVYQLGVLDAQMRDQAWFYVAFGGLFAAFGVAALLIASLGLYGVLSFVVTRRRREMGVRMALGATGHDVRGLVVRQGLTQVAIGIVIGLALAVASTGTLSNVLFNVEPRDPAIFLAVPVTIVFVGLLACWVPALRATRVSPVVALRAD